MWQKNRPNAPGELEFHLPNEKEARRHDDAWLEQRAEKLNRKHQ